jgi:hypothetical protein
MFSPTACWQAGQVFIAAKVFSTGVDVKRSATSLPHQHIRRCRIPENGFGIVSVDVNDQILVTKWQRKTNRIVISPLATN